MRIPNPKLSEYAQRKLLDELALNIIEDPSDAPQSIWEFIGRTYVGDKSYLEFSFNGWGQRVGRLDKVLHDQVGLWLSQAVSRQLRRQVDTRASEREARRQRRLARAA